jgi:hypothetical protein
VETTCAPDTGARIAPHAKPGEEGCEGVPLFTLHTDDSDGAAVAERSGPTSEVGRSTPSTPSTPPTAVGKGGHLGASASTLAGMERLRAAAARLALGEQPAEDLPMIAAEALARGVDGPLLRELAGLSRTDPSAELFAAAMAELGSPVPGAEDAWRYRMRAEAEAVVAGTVHPARGAHEVYWCAAHLPRTDDTSAVLAQFLGLWDSWEERPDIRPAVEAAIRAAAAALLADADAPRPADRDRERAALDELIATAEAEIGPITAEEIEEKHRVLLRARAEQHE